jgi:hypothetical protein
MMQVLEYIQSGRRGNKSNYAPRYQNLRKMAVFCAIVHVQIVLLSAGCEPESRLSKPSPYILMNHLIRKNHITPTGSQIHGKQPHSAQKSKGSTEQWTDARNITEQVMAAYLRSVLVVISIPIFTAQ